MSDEKFIADAIKHLAHNEKDVEIILNGKTLEEHDKQIRAESIDEFLESLELWNNKVKAIRGKDSFSFFTIDNIRKIAEQLKEKKSER